MKANGTGLLNLNANGPNQNLSLLLSFFISSCMEDKVTVDKFVSCLCFHLCTAGVTPICMQLCHMLHTWEDWNTHLAKSVFSHSTKEIEYLCHYEKQIESFPLCVVENYYTIVDSRARPSLIRSRVRCEISIRTKPRYRRELTCVSKVRHQDKGSNENQHRRLAKLVNQFTQQWLPGCDPGCLLVHMAMAQKVSANCKHLCICCFYCHLAKEVY